MMQTPADSSLGRAVAYPQRYDPALLFPIPRAQGRDVLGITAGSLPFTGHDRWHAYELGWLDARGKPAVGIATFTVPADSPQLIESKSLKLYLNSLNGERFETAAAVRLRIAEDLTRAAGAAVAVEFGLPAIDADASARSIDGCEIDFDVCHAPDPDLLACDPGDVTAETLQSALLKSNCPVTGQPDWASVSIAYRGPRIDLAGLLRYLVSYREHAGFHEQCVERIFLDLIARCRPERLSVEARYTRRGGLDINPWRATPGQPVPTPGRDLRQ